MLDAMLQAVFGSCHTVATRSYPHQLNNLIHNFTYFLYLHVWYLPYLYLTLPYTRIWPANQYKVPEITLDYFTLLVHLHYITLNKLTLPDLYILKVSSSRSTSIAA